MDFITDPVFLLTHHINSILYHILVNKNTMLKYILVCMHLCYAADPPDMPVEGQFMQVSKRVLL